jgi:hypothetical protein
LRAAVIAAALVLAAPASASIWIADNAQRAALRVGADGSAEVSWTAGGSPHTLLVPASGRLLPGGKLHGVDVSRPGGVAIPFLVAERTTSDGRIWALQRVGSELHFSRWRGPPPSVTLLVADGRLGGSVTFQGRPVHGTSPTPEGKQVRITVYLDCLGCPGKPGWSRMLGVAPHADGSFRVFLTPSWRGTRYRATVAGPNIATTLAPDASMST